MFFIFLYNFVKIQKRKKEKSVGNDTRGTSWYQTARAFYAEREPNGSSVVPFLELFTVGWVFFFFFF